MLTESGLTRTSEQRSKHTFPNCRAGEDLQPCILAKLSGPFTALIPGCVEGPLCLLLSPSNTPAKNFSKPPIGHRREQTGISAEIDLGILLGTLPLLLKGVRSCSISLLALFLPESARTQTTHNCVSSARGRLFLNVMETAGCPSNTPHGDIRSPLYGAPYELVRFCTRA